MSIEILNGRVIDPESGFDQTADLFIEDGKITGIDQKPKGFEATHTIYAHNQLVIAGMTDLGVRLGQRSEEYRGTVTTEEQAAVNSGITTLCCFPDTGPVLDTPDSINSLHQHQDEANLAKLEMIAAMTLNLNGEDLSEMISLKNAGCIGVSNAWHPMKNAQVTRRAFEYATSQKLKIFVHPEDHSLINDGCAHEGAVSTRLGLPAIPEAAETSAIGMLLPIIQQTGASVHFCRLSSRNGQNMIRRAQHDGLAVTSDVSINQLFLTEMDVMDFNPLYHTRPPLRGTSDRDALREALTNGSIQAISSDHIPLPADAKLDAFPSTSPGISGLETLLSLTLKLVDEDVVSLNRAIQLLTSGPASVAGLNRGVIKTDAVADIVVLDEAVEWDCNPYDFISIGKNSPYAGWGLRGRVTHTIVSGNLAYRS